MNNAGRIGSWVGLLAVGWLNLSDGHGTSVRDCLAASLRYLSGQELMMDELLNLIPAKPFLFGDRAKWDGMQIRCILLSAYIGS